MRLSSQKAGDPAGRNIPGNQKSWGRGRETCRINTREVDACGWIVETVSKSRAHRGSCQAQLPIAEAHLTMLIGGHHAANRASCTNYLCEDFLVHYPRYLEKKKHP